MKAAANALESLAGRHLGAVGIRLGMTSMAGRFPQDPNDLLFTASTLLHRSPAGWELSSQISTGPKKPYRSARSDYDSRDNLGKILSLLGKNLKSKR
jgi:hypothetical protein